MTINVNEEDAKLFEDNGYTYDDVKNAVEHYRTQGLSDDDIQNKINERINEFKLNSQENRYENLRSVPAQIKPYKDKNPIEKLVEGFNWVNNASYIDTLRQLLLIWENIKRGGIPIRPIGNSVSGVVDIA